MTTTVYTDAYGDVTPAQLKLYKRANVSPSDHNDISDVFVTHEAQIAFVTQHLTASGMYQAPWPFPSRRR
jgi:hypothetical protein